MTALCTTALFVSTLVAPSHAALAEPEWVTGKLELASAGALAFGPGGVLFIAATADEKIRAFDKRTGAKLWEADLPASGFATPAVYEADGRAFVVVAAGGGKLGRPSGGSYLAFSLPD